MTYTVKTLTAAMEEKFLGHDWNGEPVWKSNVASLEYDSGGIDLDGVPVEFVDGYTGGEGGGENVWMVFSVGDQLFRATGYYASHDGTYWDGSVEEVEAYEKTVTDYRKV